MTSQNGKGRIDHVEGSLRRTTDGVRNAGALRQIRERCNPAASALNPHFLFGPRWHNLKRLDVGNGEALATLELPAEFHNDLDQVKLHPALLDIATSCLLQSVEGFNPQSAFFVPVSCARVSIYAGLPPIVHSHVRRRQDSNQEQFASFDVSLYDESGREIVAIEEFTFRKMTRGDLPKPSCLAAGILPADGVEAFERALRAIDSEPELVISPWDLETGPRSDSEVQRPAAQLAVDSPPAIAAAAPPTATAVPSSAGGDEVERGIAVIWQNILGLDHLGVQDNFFQSGADSLSALRATAQIKRAFKTALTISTLYEHPTIERLAKVINAARGGRTSEVTV
jgi:aryl carrier-like protein